MSKQETKFIYISFNEKDIDTADGLHRHLVQAFEGHELVFWNPLTAAEEQYRKAAAAFLEQADLFLPCLSAHYLDHPNVRWELDYALKEQKRRPGFQLLVVQAQATFIPGALAGFPIAPAPDQPVHGFSLGPEVQLKRVAERARDLLFSVDRAIFHQEPPKGIAFSLGFEDVRERLLVLLEHCDLTPLFQLLKRLLHPERTPDDLFQLEDAFAEWRQQSQRSKLRFEAFTQTVSAIRLDLRYLIGRLDEQRFRRDWPSLFAAFYYGLQPVVAPADPLSGVFLPTGEILLPQSLNLPQSASSSAISEAETGNLTSAQQQDFRRTLVLAQDAMGIGNFNKAHDLCEHVRTNIDPQSAQLYELLLLTYLQKETPDRIVQDAVYGSSKKLNHVVVYASRLREYQRLALCPAESGLYNLRAAAEALSEALLRLYSTFQNDYILHTGRYSTEVPDNRAAVAHCVQVAMVIYRTIHPYRGFLELAANELCNGGKYDYIRQVEIIDDEFRFASHEDFGLESEVREIIGMLEAISPDDDDALMNTQLRENMFFNLKAKRFRLQAQIAEEQRRFLHFTDLRDSIVELVHAALLGYKIFGDRDYPDQESFLRLAIEQLLPGLLLPTASEEAPYAVGDLRWFTLDEKGELATHPDSRRLRFDAKAVVEKIVRDRAGKAGWLQVAPNIKKEVYREFVADTDAQYEAIRKELQWTDIRRPNETEARQIIIRCLRQWKSAWLAYPEMGTVYLQKILQELTGSQLLQWMKIEPPQLVTVAESLGLGYDAAGEFRQLLELPHGMGSEEVLKMLAVNMFQRQIQPAFQKIVPRNEARRKEAGLLLLAALQLYRDLHASPAFTDFVFEELTRENKFSWMDISPDGTAIPWENAAIPFDPVAILQQLAQIQPDRYRLLEARQRIAALRHADLKGRYFREISEYTHENRQIERQIAVDIIRKMKGLFLFYPDEAFLELPIRELEGHGRIRWHENFLGLLPSRSNHYENRYFNFDYRQELSEFRMYRTTRLQWMEHVLRQTGDLT